jgi:hypothetical protein
MVSILKFKDTDLEWFNATVSEHLPRVKEFAKLFSDIAEHIASSGTTSGLPTLRVERGPRNIGWEHPHWNKLWMVVENDRFHLLPNSPDARGSEVPR